MKTKKVPNCLCGGNPRDITTRYGYGAIECQSCGIRTKEENGDSFNYKEKVIESWRLVMEVEAGIPRQDEACYPWAVPLQSLILSKHNGNVTNFAKSQGVSPSQAGRWLKRNCVVIDGVVYCEVSKQVKSE